MFIRRLKSLLIGLVLLSLTLFLVQSLSLTDLRHAFSAISLNTVIALLLLQLLTLLLLTLQYHLLFKDFHLPLPFKTLLSMHFIGVFYESITPMFKVGGEVFKIRYLKQKGYEKLHTSSVIVRQKTLSFTAFFTLLLITIIVSLSRHSMITRALPVWLYFFLALGLIVLLSLSALIVFKKRFPDHYNTFKSHLKNSTNHRVVHTVIAFSIWLLFSAKSYLLFQHFNLSITFIDAQLITLLTYTVSLIPLAPGALGTNEASMVGLLSLFLVPFHQALALTMILRFTTFWFVFILSATSLLMTTFNPLRRRMHATS